MVTYTKLVEILIQFGVFLATSVATITAIIALVVTNKDKK